MNFEDQNTLGRLRLETRHQEYLISSARAYLTRVRPLSQEYHDTITMLDAALSELDRLHAEERSARFKIDYPGVKERTIQTHRCT